MYDPNELPAVTTFLDLEDRVSGVLVKQIGKLWKVRIGEREVMRRPENIVPCNSAARSMLAGGGQ